MWVKAMIVGLLPVLFTFNPWVLLSRSAVFATALPQGSTKVENDHITNRDHGSVDAGSGSACAFLQPLLATNVASSMIPDAANRAEISPSGNAGEFKKLTRSPSRAKAHLRSQQLLSDRKLRITHIFTVLNRISDVSTQMTPERAVWLEQIVEDLAQQTLDVADAAFANPDSARSQPSSRVSEELRENGQASLQLQRQLQAAPLDPIETSLGEIERTLAELTGVIEHMIEPEMSL